MAKAKKAETVAVAAEQTAVEVATVDATAAVAVDAKAPRKQYRISMVLGARFAPGTEERPNARLEYYKRFCAFNGRTLEELAADIAANPPSTPRKGKLTGMQEPFSGWVSFFKGGKKGAQKLLSLVEVAE